MHLPWSSNAILTIGKAAVLLLLFAYWFCTILYVSPNNPIRASLPTLTLFWETHFYQKWEFFAPPPTSNEKVYLEILNEDMIPIKIFDLSGPIIEGKKSHHPFNDKYESLDYMLHGPVGIVRTLLLREYEIAMVVAGRGSDLSKGKKLDEEVFNKIAQSVLNPYTGGNPGLTTMVTYAAYTLQDRPELHHHKARLFITDQKIISVGQRMKGLPEPELERIITTAPFVISDFLKRE